MFGNLGSALQQIATGLTTGQLVTAIATIALAIVFITWMFGFIGYRQMASVIIGIAGIGSVAAIVSTLLGSVVLVAVMSRSAHAAAPTEFDLALSYVCGARDEAVRMTQIVAANTHTQMPSGIVSVRECDRIRNLVTKYGLEVR